jgi:protein involved in polysaccharide export with SLBB domain
MNQILTRTIKALASTLFVCIFSFLAISAAHAQYGAASVFQQQSGGAPGNTYTGAVDPTQAAAQARAAGVGGVASMGMIPPNQQQPFNNAYVQSKPNAVLKPQQPSAFELYVQMIAGEMLPRFGADIVKDGDQSFSPSSTAAIPNDYSVATGDEIYIRMWGSADGDMRAIVDRNGEIAIPKVGAVRVAGVHYGALSRTIQNAISQIYSGVNVSASIGQMRGIRVYVTGYAQSPGAYTVNNLSSLVNVVMAAGGPSTAGSFRNVQLIRGGKVVSNFDLYDLLLKGNKSADRPLVADDVIHVGAAGAYVAVMGAVNKPAIYEVKKGEKVKDLLAFTGGFASGAQKDVINYLPMASRREGFREIRSSGFGVSTVNDGDIFMVISDVGLLQPNDRQTRMIRVDGQVNRPGVYPLKPGQTIQDAIQAAGGLAPNAYLFGARLERNTVKMDQEKALTRFKIESRRALANDGARKQTNAEDAALAAATKDRTNAILSALEEVKPDGRLNLAMKVDSKELPPILVEAGDVLTIPSTPNNVIVLGSIPSGQMNLAYRDNSTTSDYVKMAGGYSRGADSSQTYVIRASGEFVATSTGFFGGFTSTSVYPGDVIVVPEDFQKTTFTKELKDWAQILYQLGLGAAAIKVLGQ